MSSVAPLSAFRLEAIEVRFIDCLRMAGCCA